MDVNTILEFWFGSVNISDNQQTAKQQAKLWWSKDDAVDKEIQHRFEPTLKALLTGHYSNWFETPQGRLAAIIVLDQFSRNMYRNSAHAFSQDSLALYWTLEGIRQGDDKKLSPLQKVFFYLPLEHCEQLSMQNLAIEKFEQLAANSYQGFADLAQGFLDFAHQHHAVISQFGRFPHRNALLSRTSSAEELEYLAKPGAGF